MEILTFDSLRVFRHPDRLSLGAAAARRVASSIRRTCRERGGARVVFACAPSQNEFLAALVREALDWNLVTVFHMDDYVGLPADHPKSFRRYLSERLLSCVERPRCVHFLAAENEPALECERYAALLAEAPLDLVCMGIGENGHVAFNDPPVADFHDPLLVKVVELDLACRQQQINDGCFPSLGAVPSRALTLTVPALFEAREISCVVPGERKARAVRDTLVGPVDARCPASILRTHPRAVLHIDSAAASLLPA